MKFKYGAKVKFVKDHFLAGLTGTVGCRYSVTTTFWFKPDEKETKYIIWLNKPLLSGDETIKINEKYIEALN